MQCAKISISYCFSFKSIIAFSDFIFPKTKNYDQNHHGMNRRKTIRNVALNLNNYSFLSFSVVGEKRYFSKILTSQNNRDIIIIIIIISCWQHGYP